ncbi:hypothetical protein KUTeg_007149 [Tegillarca granosa]|uniref:superoxide dismutase n=1 Tax=Tegillarca granosa TaxID=220873 RepID=A0ABQ9FCE9_TEGGR|nr:hypothetical protein KUTeg_007149 [Tegillarca granosa]
MLSAVSASVAKSILPKTGALGTLVARLKHTLPDLPYDYNALEPYISADIMKLHHQKHHQTYVNNLNAAEEQLAEAMHKGKISQNSQI